MKTKKAKTFSLLFLKQLEGSPQLPQNHSPSLSIKIIFFDKKVLNNIKYFFLLIFWKRTCERNPRRKRERQARVSFKSSEIGKFQEKKGKKRHKQGDPQKQRLQSPQISSRYPQQLDKSNIQSENDLNVLKQDNSKRKLREQSLNHWQSVGKKRK